MPLHRRLPKRGFTNIFRTEYTVVNLDRLVEHLEGLTLTEISWKTTRSWAWLRARMRSSRFSAPAS